MKKYTLFIMLVFLFLLPDIALAGEPVYTAEPILEYDSIQNLDDGIFLASRYNRLHRTRTNYLLDSTGAVLSVYGDCTIQNAGEGMLLVSGNVKNGYFDYSGNLLIPMRYDSGNPFHDGMAKVVGDSARGYKEGFINTSGDLKIPFLYDRAGDFHEGLAWVERNEKVGFINTNGKTVISLQYSKASHFNEGLACVQQDGYYGYINKVGKTIIPFQYKYASDFSNGYAFVRKETGMSIIDATGKTIKNLAVDGIPHFVQCRGYVMIQEISKYYYGEHEHLLRGFDNAGNEMTFEQMEFAENVSEGLAPVEQNGLFGYVDEKGKQMVPFVFEWADRFCGGFALVKKQGKYGIIQNPMNDQKSL